MNAIPQRMIQTKVHFAVIFIVNLLNLYLKLLFVHNLSFCVHSCRRLPLLVPLRKRCADIHRWTTWLRRHVLCCRTHPKSTRCWVISTALTLPTYRSEQFRALVSITHVFSKPPVCSSCCRTGAGVLGVPVRGGRGPALGAGLQGHPAAAELFGAVGSLAGQRGHPGAQALRAPAQLPQGSSTIPAEMVFLQVWKGLKHSVSFRFYSIETKALRCFLFCV